MANTYLKRTGISSGNQKKWTFSGWFKKSTNGSELRLITSSDNSSYDDNIRFASDDTIKVIYNNATVIGTNRKFRDVSGYYHILVKVDTDQSTANDRIVLYINGVDERTVGGYADDSMPNQGVTGYINYNAFYIGVTNPSANSNHFNGIMSHVHFTDGYAYTASSFGSTDTATGEWKITVAPSVTYGSNGVWLFKNDNAVTDRSGQGNNFTSVGAGITKTEDNPSNVFCTINPLYRMDLTNNATLSNGNNTFSSDQSGYNIRYGTLGASKGKFYYECKFISFSPETSPGMPFGISASQIPSGAQNGGYAQYDYSYNYDGSNGTVQYNAVGGQNAVNYGTTPLNAVGQIGMCAFDLDNNKLYFGVNGVWANSGNPAGNANGFSIVDPDSTELGIYFPSTADRSSARSYVYSFNFGNGYFGTTAVSSAGTNASNNGIFEYAVPSGFTALSTKGLNT